MSYSFKNQSVEKTCFTHKSLGSCNYERLELIGDRVLKLVQTTYLIEADPTANEGTVTQRLSQIENNRWFAVLAQRMGLINRLQVSKSVRLNKRTRDRLSADVFEAYVGAIFVDCGMNGHALDRVYQLYQSWCKDYGDAPENHYPNPVGQLQEAMQKVSNEIPVYDICKKSGKDHNPIFECTCRTLWGVSYGKGNNKKLAKEMAALEAVKTFL
jgi:ribonuclease-3